nr:hypothetical protein [Tanacetum cinerariifolium]
MSTQQDIYAAGSASRPPMLNKENYVPWSSRLLRYAKSRPNGKLIHNSILNGPYVIKMIPKPGDANRKITVTKTFHLQTDDELSDKELKQIEADDQAIQTILLGLPEDIYAVEKKAKLFNEWERFTSNKRELIESYYHRFLKLMNNLKRNKHFPEKIASNMKFLNNLQPEWTPHQDQSSFNQNYLQQPMPNPEDITDPTTAMNMAPALMAKAFKLNYSTPTNNNKRISSNPRNRKIAQPRNSAGYNDVIGNQGIQNAVQNPRVQNVRNQNGLIGVQRNGNQNQIGNGHYARNCTVRPMRRDAAYLQTQLLIAQKEEAGIQLQAEEYDLMAVAADLDEIEEVNANCILMANLQQASTS